MSTSDQVLSDAPFKQLLDIAPHFLVRHVVKAAESAPVR
jgi:hypothetical protein